jgi:hypothetical protein
LHLKQRRVWHQGESEAEEITSVRLPFVPLTTHPWQPTDPSNHLHFLEAKSRQTRALYCFFDILAHHRYTELVIVDQEHPVIAYQLMPEYNSLIQPVSVEVKVRQSLICTTYVD